MPWMCAAACGSLPPFACNDVVLPRQAHVRVWGLAPTVGLIITLALVWRTHRFLARAARAPGRIARVTREQREQWRGQGEGRETATFYIAHVEFSPKDGTTLEFRSATLTQPPHVGQTVTVAYEPRNPETTARIDDGVIWRWPAIAGGLTVALSLFSIVTLWGQPIVALPIATAALIAALPTLLRRLRHPAP